MLNDYSSSTKMWDGYPITWARYFYPINLDPQHYFSYSTDRYFSLYGNLSYTFNDKYTLTGSIRTDASNLITDDPKYRYSPFWSTGFGWQMGKEDFLKGVEWLDRLNLRGTYGYNGNVDKSTSFLPLISVSGTANIYTNETTANVSSFGNPTLRWEKTRSLDIGLDFSVLKSKLHGSIDVYHKKGSDLIVSQSIASMNGTTSQKFNNGEMVNKGIELKIGTSLPLLGNDIKWNGNFNFAYNKNEITSFYKASYAQYDLYNGGTYAYSEGLNANTLWSFEYAGMRNLGTEADPKMVPTVKGVDGDTYGLTRWTPGTDARKFMVAEGTTVAPYIVGFHNSFKIYDFDLSFIITGKFGHVYRRHSFNYPAMTGGNTNVNNKYSEVANGDPNKIVPIPGNEPRYYFYDRFFPYMSYLTENASHIRFQEASLSYNLPKQMISKLGFERVKVYAQGNNLGTILWNDFGEDPEYPIGTLKPQATYTLGVKISL
ncbi:TonB-dependent receptor domain-containing protein [Marinifilum fragile]|uniref:TonB-dependent receptor domain-containing protein n=1 Tax=Marinifilum fragile TaxID=570161 RepID=UPI002AAAFB07|nr:TonB-dependent receptor [Marinifilum fragile]